MHAHSQTDPHTVHRPSRTLRETTSGQCSASTGASSPSGTAASPASSGRNGRNGRNGRIVTQRYGGPCCARVGNKQLSVKLMENGSSGTAGLAALGCAASIHSIVHPRSGRRRAKIGLLLFWARPWCTWRALVRSEGANEGPSVYVSCAAAASRATGAAEAGAGCMHGSLSVDVCLQQPKQVSVDLLTTT